MVRRLAHVVHPHIGHASRRKGDLYYRQGRVLRLVSSETEYAASVRGTLRYDVNLQVRGDRLSVACSCPYFSTAIEPCKHIWAAILAADNVGAIRVPDDLRLDQDSLPGYRLEPDDDRDLDDADIESGAPVDADDRPAIRGPWRQRAPSAPPPADWEHFLAHVTTLPQEVPPPRALLTGELIYVFDPARSVDAGGLLIELMVRERKKSGEWARPRPLSLTRRDIALIPDERDRHILDAMCGADTAYAYGGPVWTGYGSALPVPAAAILTPTLQRGLVPQLCATGRLLLRVTAPAGSGSEGYAPIGWDPRPASFVLRITDVDGGAHVDGAILRGGVERPLTDPRFVTAQVVLWRATDADPVESFASFDPGGAERWLRALLERGPVTVPAGAAAALASTLAAADLARVECPPALRLDTRVAPPRPYVRIGRERSPAMSRGYAGPDRADVTMAFVYGDGEEQREVGAWTGGTVVVNHDRQVAWRRDPEAERAALDRLHTFGVRRLADWDTGGTRLDMAVSAVPALVRALLAEGWLVETDGRLYRTAVTTTLDVRSGIDWFELHGSVDYGGIGADLPTLLAAVRRGESVVTLSDGTLGLVPADWLTRAGRIATLGTPQDDHLRFAPAQTTLLDAWLATQPAVSTDATFARARAEIATFDGITPVDPPSSFAGVLRDYQRDALGWFAFLRRFRFGGCLADEMGLGKTIMVLALLDARRREREAAGTTPRPSLIVMPRSLVFNWRQESARFTPSLRVLDFTGGNRRGAIDHVQAHDVVLTTYGTLRRDIGFLKAVNFDYVILDEAQTVKNARTSGAKAARLLIADHRLALSGTPVENRLSELWSLFEFLNPGMLGGLSVFSSGTGGQTPDAESLALLARGLRPFILRRTKEQVATELPARTEQTLYCDLEAPQRALYDELRDHYRAALLGRIARDGIGRSKIHVLEALLRLRQAACHPALIDAERAGEASAKLDVLLPRLQELIDDGRQAIVFSQFTSLLALLRQRLDDAGLTYEYLDGRTRDRAARVERFQAKACPLFLVSLKAGGVGLNLTAAEYVFLLDPWWNPAVEAQAIDRSHRIGQTRPVFAFRLIARNTVEEKVLELQSKKRELAEAIVRADSGVLRDLRKEDLELLLS